MILTPTTIIRFVSRDATRTSCLTIQCRNLSVKELSWCSKSNRQAKQYKVGASEHGQDVHKPIERFGIVAAMSKNHVIGVKGCLPWNIPADRKEFVRITRNKTIIIGRKTLDEQPTLSHISHTAKCIVITRTLISEDADRLSKLTPNTEIHIVPSFLDALDLARKLNNIELATKTSNDVKCWVAGGEGIYNMAVLHPSAYWLHLTVINIDIDISSYCASDIARFPPKYHWDKRFVQRSAIENVKKDDHDEVKFTQYIYSKKSAVGIVSP